MIVRTLRFIVMRVFILSTLVGVRKQLIRLLYGWQHVIVAIAFCKFNTDCGQTYFTCYCHEFLKTFDISGSNKHVKCVWLNCAFYWVVGLGQREARRFCRIWDQFISKCQVAFSEERVGGTRWYWKYWALVGGPRLSTSDAANQMGNQPIKGPDHGRSCHPSPPPPNPLWYR